MEGEIIMMEVTILHVIVREEDQEHLHSIRMSSRLILAGSREEGQEEGEHNQEQGNGIDREIIEAEDYYNDF